jgi:L-aspartate oxidase
MNDHGRPLRVEHHRVVVVGGGIAALSAALELGAATVLVDRAPGSGSSPWAQGGMAAAVGPGDSPADHASDTVAVSAGLGDADAARTITGAAPEVVAWLQAHGARFDTGPDGTPALGREAGHRARRIVHARGDATGAEIMRALVEAVGRAPGLDVRSGVAVVDLVRDEAGTRVVGVLGRDRDGVTTVYLADAVILGTGGYGHLFAATTNPPEVAGAAMAMAARAGIAVADAELVQFHPTALAVPGADPLPLLTEALRGEGAVLVNDRGERYLTAWHPDAELAPRDVVARGNYAELVAGRRPCLDARAAVGEAFPERFPTVFALARAAGLDPRTDLLPVSPAAHYCMGGVATDVEGRSSAAGLWVVGEAASNGVHGANRLASNSLLEGVVMGRAAAAAIRAASASGAVAPPDGPERFVVAEGALSLAAVDDADIVAGLRSLLWRRAGVVRDEDGLRLGLDELAGFAVAATGEAGRRARDAWEVAGLVLQAALARSESRGAHYRADHPETDPARSRRHIVRPRPTAVVGLVLDRSRPGPAVAVPVPGPVSLSPEPAGATGPTRVA